MKKKILIIDDNEVILHIIELILVYEQFDVETASSGEEGLHQFKSFNPDVVLLDFMLPGLNGREVCEKIRILENGRTVPIIVVTAVSQETVADMDVDAFLKKPFETSELLQKIRSVLKSKKENKDLRCSYF